MVPFTKSSERNPWVLPGLDPVVIRSISKHVRRTVHEPSAVDGVDISVDDCQQERYPETLAPAINRNEEGYDECENRR